MNKLKQYANKPLSFIALILIIISTLITALAIIFIIGYILIKGVPNLSVDLFSLKYSSANQSMLPSIINTVYRLLLRFFWQFLSAFFRQSIWWNMQEKALFL